MRDSLSNCYPVSERNVVTAADRRGKSEHVEIGDVVACAYFYVHISRVLNTALTLPVTTILGYRIYICPYSGTLSPRYSHLACALLQ